MALYDTRFGLPQSEVDYLNQPLPDISGIFSALPQSSIYQPIQEVTETAPSIGITPEQLRLLYLQQQRGGGDGRDDDNDIDRTDNLGINSFADAFSAIQGQMTPGSVIGGLLGGIPGALIGRGIGSLVDRFRDDPYGGFSTKGISPDVQAAIEKDIQREAKDYDTGGNGGSKGGRSDPYGGGPGGLHS